MAKQKNNICRKCKRKEIPYIDAYHLHLCEDCLEDDMRALFKLPVLVREYSVQVDVQTKLDFSTF